MQAAPVRQTFANGNMAHKQRNRSQTAENWRKVVDGLAKSSTPPSPLYSQIKNKASQQRNRSQTAKNWRKIVDGLANTASAVKFRRLPVR